MSDGNWVMEIEWPFFVGQTGSKVVSFIASKFIYSIQIKSSYFIQNQQQERSLLLHLINLKMLEKKKMELII